MGAILKGFSTGLESEVPAIKRMQTYSLDCTTTEISHVLVHSRKQLCFPLPSLGLGFAGYFEHSGITKRTMGIMVQ